MKNHLKSVLLLSTLTAVVLAAGQALGGSQGLGVALGFALLLNAAAYWYSDKIVLTLYKAKPLSSTDPSGVYSLVQRLAQQEGLPMPKVYRIDQDAPNAFATGRNPQHGAVAVTTGLLEILNRQELEGVLAHELGHIKNRDTLVSTIAAVLAGTLSMLADMAMWGSLYGRGSQRENSHPLAGIIGIILAPLAGMMIQSAISRAREFMADATGARSTGNPLALASALEKIEAYAKRTPLSGATPATAHMFIINPFRGRQMLQLFSTHPPTRERVKRLAAMAESQSFIRE